MSNEELISSLATKLKKQRKLSTYAGTIGLVIFSILLYFQIDFIASYHINQPDMFNETAYHMQNGIPIIILMYMSFSGLALMTFVWMLISCFHIGRGMNKTDKLLLLLAENATKNS